ncbi:MAG: TetR/AcrR family transcriptional regulator, partial [Pikeienuella sp.]
RHGYAAVSMREIAGEVGVGAGALYNHFATKQDLLVALMERHMAGLLSAWAKEPGARLESNPVTALESFTRFHIRYHKDLADEVSVAYMELRSLEQPNFHRIEQFRREYEDQLVAILDRGVAAGVFHAPDTKIAAMAIIAMLTGMTTWFRTGGRLSVNQIENLYVDMVARSVRPT